MSSKNSIANLISIALIGSGAVGFAVTSKPLMASNEVDVPLNVLGINRSPYGEVVAMAMQGPIDSYFHETAVGGGHICAGSGSCKHEPFVQKGTAAANGDTINRLKRFIEGMGHGIAERTNPRSASAAHSFYLRRRIEDKLRFAYDLDPGHYGNYNAYHFFLTEPQLGTRPELTPHAVQLADETIAYCLSQRNDPRQALTAAAAAGNILELMLNDRQINSRDPRYTTAQMRKVLKIMDQSISLFSYLSNDWVEKKTWENLSDLRIAEIDERLYFIGKIRDNHEKSIRRLEEASEASNTASQPLRNFR